jgi:hypothetical protein
MGNWNLNYPDYREMFPSYGGYAPSTPEAPGNPGAAPMQGYAPMMQGAAGAASMALPWAGFGLQALGTVANVMGASNASDEAAENARKADERYAEELRAREEERKHRKEQDGLANAFRAGNYTQEYQDDIRKRYGEYYNQVRM